MLRANLTYDARCKSRLLLQLDNGEQAALLVERGKTWRNGEHVTALDGREIEIVFAEESLVEATARDPRLIARAAYHLGNRHVALQLMPDRLRFLADHVLAEMVAGLGLSVSAVAAPFEPEGGAYGHHHAHGNAALMGRPKIHSFTES